MSTHQKTAPIWGVVAAALTLGTLLSAILATVTLDAFLEGPGPASVTTRVPGFVYATATVMKVCMVTGVVLSVISLVRRVAAGRTDHAQSAPDTPRLRFPVWGIASITLAPLTPFVGAVTVVTVQALAHAPEGLSMVDLSRLSRTAVVVTLFLISAGAIAAVTSLVRRERPLLLPALGLATNALLIGLFWHFEFYAVGFDQDTWAPH